MKFLKRVVAASLAVMVVISLLPPVYAVDNASVLTSIGHSSTDTVALSASERNVTLTVPYDYSGSEVDLVNGLIITWDETAYKSVVAVPASAAEVDGDAVAVTVTFNAYGDADGAEKSRTVYYVRVKRAAMTPAVFAGVIEKTIVFSPETTVAFSETDFTSLYAQNDGEALGHITISGSNLVVGTLMHNGANYAFESLLYPSDLDDISFSAAACGTVSYDVNAYGASTNGLIGTAVLTITVYRAPAIESPVTKIAYAGTNLGFSASDFTDCCDLYGMPLNILEITPGETGCGTWYFENDTISGATPVPAAKIGKLSFACTSAGTAAFRWRVSNSAGFSNYGTGSISVSALSITLSAYSAPSVTRGSEWTASASNFAHSPSSASLKYIKISTIPPGADGYLYLTKTLEKNATYGYGAISAGKALSAGAIIPYSFVQYLKISTKSTSTSSCVSFTWTATADSDASSAVWADPVSYTIRFLSGGTVSYDTYKNVPVTLDASDFSSAFSSASGYSLSYVLFTPPAQTSGTLYYDYSLSAKSGTKVSASTKYYTGTSPNLSYLTFVPAAGYTGTVSIAYKAYNSGGDYFSGTLTIHVSNAAGGTIVYTTDKNAGVQLDAADFSEAFMSATGEELSYVSFTLPSSSYGKLYYNYVSPTNYDATVSSSRKYYVYASSYLSYVSFVPYDDFTGAAVISFKGCNKNGDGYSGKLIILVVDSPAGIVCYSSKVNGITRLSGDDFAEEFIGVTGSVLSYVQFALPDRASGVLYSDYSPEAKTGTKVTASTKYYNGTGPDISDISFVPTADFVGVAEMKYTVYTASGASYIGKLKINVGEASSGSIYYETGLNTSFALNANDFISRYYANTGGSILSYVTFALPSTTYGKLYYSAALSTSYDSLVKADTKYYAGSSPSISNITFVPKTGYSGSFSITYTGYSTDGTGYSGKIYITVKSGEGLVAYKTSRLEPVTFSASDFSTAFYDEMGSAVRYVKFSPPSSSYGRLYYDYSSSDSYGSSVSYTTKYYVSTYPYLSRVTFVPNSSFEGSVSIDCTAYDADGEAYEGTVMITVTGSDCGAVKYQTLMNVPVTLDPDDFSTVFSEETGYTLSYVKFSLPDLSYGQLYYGYASDSQYTSKVSASTKYYRTASPLLSNVTFVPKESFSGTVTIGYTGYTSSGKSYAGELVIDVARPFSDMVSGYSWADTAVSYLYNNNIVTGSGGRFYPGKSMSRGDFMLMVYRAFGLSVSGSGNFSDVNYGSYYYDAIAAAKSLGIARGNGGHFCPDSDISRQDAMVVILRTLEVLGKNPALGTASDLAGYADADEISSYAVEAVATLVKAGVITGSGGALKPKSMISRAEMAVILYRVLTL